LSNIPEVICIMHENATSLWFLHLQFHCLALRCTAAVPLWQATCGTVETRV